MSYILDALRRADAERERGNVPGLHARAASAAVVPGAAPAWRAGLIGLGAGGALALLALAVWQIGSMRGGSVAEPPPPSPAPTAVVAPPPVRVEAAPTAPVQPPAVAAPAAPAPVAVALPTARKRIPSPLAAPDAPRAAVVASAPAVPPVSTLAALPDDIRRQLPALAVGGSAYSTSAASRFVIVNGQLFHEGDALAPGLVLEQIRLKSAVLAFKGYRYGINF